MTTEEHAGAVVRRGTIGALVSATVAGRIVRAHVPG